MSIVHFLCIDCVLFFFLLLISATINCVASFKQKFFCLFIFRLFTMYTNISRFFFLSLAFNLNFVALASVSDEYVVFFQLCVYLFTFIISCFQANLKMSSPTHTHTHAHIFFQLLLVYIQNQRRCFLLGQESNVMIIDCVLTQCKFR